jgi:hypothetical protein
VVNRLAARQLTLVSQAASSARAILQDGARQGYLYRRGYALWSSPESAAGDLWAELGDPALPPEVLDLLDYPDRIRRGSNVETLESVNLDDLDAAWENLQRQMRLEAEAARRAGEDRSPAPASSYRAYVLDGTPEGESARRRNGTPQAAAKHDGTPGPGES